MTRPEAPRLALDEPEVNAGRLRLGAHAEVLYTFARAHGPELLAAIRDVAAISPFRQMVTQSGWKMSVAMTNCGEAGWVSDRTGYRYDLIDPDTCQAWPAMPRLFREIATGAADTAGFRGFEPDACLINRYAPGARLSLHRDRNENDFGQPIVTVSLGLPAVFLWGGERREDRPIRVKLVHGDVLVWGGPDRLNFHGVRELADGHHPLTGGMRYSLTFRKAL